MAATAGAQIHLAELGDPLQYLPAGRVSTVRRGSVIYDGKRPASGLYWLNTGRAAISMPREGEPNRAFEVQSPGQFLGFGPLAFAGWYAERATALDDCTVMFWPEDLARRRLEMHPHLGIALMRAVTRRSLRLAERVVSLSRENATNRLARLLLWMAEDSGGSENGGWLEVPALTHATLAAFIGTTREVATTSMNTLRRERRLTYNRHTIGIAEEALRERLTLERRRTRRARQPVDAGSRNSLALVSSTSQPNWLGAQVAPAVF